MSATSAWIEDMDVGRTRAIAIANQKGGVGKSTTAINLAVALGERGRTVLVVDMDPQGNATTGLGMGTEVAGPNCYDLLMRGIEARSTIVRCGATGVSVLPATIDLAGAEIELVNQLSRETRLRKALAPLRGEFDFMMIDCPPSLGLLTVNALSAADELLAPIQCEYYALEGLGQLIRNVRLIQESLNPDLRMGGILLTMFDARTQLSSQVVSEVRAYFGDLVYQTVVPRSVRIAEAPGFGRSVLEHAPESRGARAYRWLAEEVLGRPGIAGGIEWGERRLTGRPAEALTDGEGGSR